MAVQASPAGAPAPAAAPSDAGHSGANAQSTSPEPTPASSPSQSEQASRGPDYFREAFNRVRGVRQTTDQATRNTQALAPQAPPEPTAPRPEQERNGAAPRRQTPAPGHAPAQQPSSALPQHQQQQPAQQPEILNLTQEQFARAVQSEADRVLAKREADARARQAREEERQLRQDDPFEYVKRLEEREAQEAQTQERTRETIGYLEQQLHHYDRGVLDVIMGALPEKIRTSILKSTKAEGIPGRSEITKQSLKALQQYWQHQGREGARTALMRDEKFVKEVLARYGGSPGEVDPTPSLPPSAARVPTSNEAVNNWMRAGAAQVRQTSGRR